MQKQMCANTTNAITRACTLTEQLLIKKNKLDNFDQKSMNVDGLSTKFDVLRRSVPQYAIVEKIKFR